MGDRYEPYPDIRRLLLGTPGILGMAAAEVGIGLVADAGMAAIAAKGRALTGFALDLCREHRARVADPARSGPAGRPRRRHRRRRRRRPRRAHPRGASSPTSGGPDLIRLGCAALTTRFVDVFDGVTALAG